MGEGGRRPDDGLPFQRRIPVVAQAAAGRDRFRVNQAMDDRGLAAGTRVRGARKAWIVWMRCKNSALMANSPCKAIVNY